MSKGGGIAFIKSSLSNLSIYFLFLFPIPVGVANQLAKLFQDLLWGGLGEEAKFYLVNWDKISSPLSCGGAVIDSKYGSAGGFGKVLGVVGMSL